MIRSQSKYTYTSLDGAFVCILPKLVWYDDVNIRSMFRKDDKGVVVSAAHDVHNR